MSRIREVHLRSLRQETQFNVAVVTSRLELEFDRSEFKLSIFETKCRRVCLWAIC